MVMKTGARAAAEGDIAADMSQMRKATYNNASVMVIIMPEIGGRPPHRLMRPLRTERSYSWPVGIGARQQIVQHRPQSGSSAVARSPQQAQRPDDHAPSASVFLSGVFSAIAARRGSMVFARLHGMLTRLGNQTDPRFPRLRRRCAVGLAKC